MATRVAMVFVVAFSSALFLLLAALMMAVRDRDEAGIFVVSFGGGVTTLMLAFAIAFMIEALKYETPSDTPNVEKTRSPSR
jgi:hypothetical protein